MAFDVSTFVHPYGHVFKLMRDVVDTIPEVDGRRFTVFKCSVEDVTRLDLREEQRHTFDNTDIDFVIRAHAWLNLLTPMNYSLYHGDELLLLASIQPTAIGVGEISFLVDKNLVNASKLVRFHSLQIFRKAIDALPFHRLQARVATNFPVAVRFVEGMGLEREGVLKGFGQQNKQDYYIYGLVK